MVPGLEGPFIYSFSTRAVDVCKVDTIALSQRPIFRKGGDVSIRHQPRYSLERPAQAAAPSRRLRRSTSVAAKTLR